jgi:hypothetical protein
MTKLSFVHFSFNCKLDLLSDQPRSKVLPTGVTERFVIASLQINFWSLQTRQMQDLLNRNASVLGRWTLKYYSIA